MLKLNLPTDLERRIDFQLENDRSLVNWEEGI